MEDFIIIPIVASCFYLQFVMQSPWLSVISIALLCYMQSHSSPLMNIVYTSFCTVYSSNNTTINNFSILYRAGICIAWTMYSRCYDSLKLKELAQICHFIDLIELHLVISKSALQLNVFPVEGSQTSRDTASSSSKIMEC